MKAHVAHVDLFRVACAGRPVAAAAVDDKRDALLPDAGGLAGAPRQAARRDHAHHEGASRTCPHGCLIRLPGG